MAPRPGLCEPDPAHCPAQSRPQSSPGEGPQAASAGGARRRRVRPLLCRLWLELKRPWRALKLFYSGASIEQSWAAIHRARATLFMLYPLAELNVQTRMLQGMLAESPDLASLLRSLTTYVSHNPPVAELRPQLRDTYEEMIEASDQAQRDARALRNTLLIASLALSAVILGIGLAHLLDPQIITLCGQYEHKDVCPVDTRPQHFDIFAVALAGMLGGLLSVVIPLATGERIKTPYRVFNFQLVLKTLAGAATALAGVLLVESTFISLIPVKDSVTIFGYAVFFGFSQQVVTGAVDRRADSLARQTPSVKDI